jgi:hypothetical protein
MQVLLASDDRFRDSPLGRLEVDHFGQLRLRVAVTSSIILCRYPNVPHR